MAGRMTCAVAAAVLAAVVLSLAEGCRAPAGAAGSAASGDVAVVTLSGPNRLVVVDLARERVVSDVRLRSFVTDLAVDATSGMAVTAQAGGVGPEADDVVGLYDVRRGGLVRYVRLPHPNPGSVAIAQGRAVVEHGLIYDDSATGRSGMLASLVDIGRRRVEATALVPPTLAGRLSTHDGAVWDVAGSNAVSAAGLGPDGLPPAWVTRISPADLTARRIAGPLSGNQILGAGPGMLYLLSGAADGAPAEVRELDARDGRTVRRARVPSLARGARLGCVADRWLVLSDWDGQEPADPGRTVTWLDRSTLSAVGTLDLAGGACAMSAWGGRVVAVDVLSNLLVVIDPRRGVVVSTVPLGGRPGIAADVEVLADATG